MSCAQGWECSSIAQGSLEAFVLQDKPGPSRTPQAALFCGQRCSSFPLCYALHKNNSILRLNSNGWPLRFLDSPRLGWLLLGGGQCGTNPHTASWDHKAPLGSEPFLNHWEGLLVAGCCPAVGFPHRAWASASRLSWPCCWSYCRGVAC